MRADPAELVRPREAAADNPVADMNMAGQRRVVGHDRVAADDAVVRDVHVGHDPVVVTHDRFTPVLGRAAAERAEFADRIAVADHEARRLAGVFLVLRIVADRGELVDAVVLADTRRPVDDDVAADARTGTDLDVIADDRVRTDFDVGGNICAAGDDSRCMDHLLSSFLTRLSSASRRRMRATMRVQTFDGSAANIPL